MQYIFQSTVTKCINNIGVTVNADMKFFVIRFAASKYLQLLEVNKSRTVISSEPLSESQPLMGGVQKSSIPNRNPGMSHVISSLRNII